MGKSPNAGTAKSTLATRQNTLSVGMAKELAMIERTEQAPPPYFIQCEEEYSVRA
ncbi:hypothetical protein QT319_04430 [Escherichia coli]|nr:hypothetical protein [Escherichia coli]